jgi:hypothetical protein
MQANRKSIKELFSEYAVEAESVEAFVEKYYKHERLRGRGDEYAECIIASAKQYLSEHGIYFISWHESVTGDIVAFLPKESE